MVSFFLSFILEDISVPTFLFSVFIHQNTESTTVLCIYNSLKKSPKALLKISLIDVDSVYNQEANTIKLMRDFPRTS